MADPVSLAAISGTLELVNKSVDLVRNLRKKGDEELTSAEMRLTLLDLLDDLLEVKSEFLTLKAVLLSKEEQIQDLKAQLEGKNSLEHDGQLYWKNEDKTPFCPICYEKDSSSIHLTYIDDRTWYCLVCQNTQNLERM